MGIRADLLNAPLLRLAPHDLWDVRTALTHTLVFGTTGAGKSSGTMAYIIRSMLRAGFGAMFCVAKPEDAEAIVGYCRESGRLGSLIDWNGRNGGFNFLAAELARSSNINNVIDVLMEVLEMVRSSSGTGSGKSGDQFWTEAMQQMLRATIPVVFAATGTVAIRDILAFIRSAPATPQQMRDPAWQQDAAFFRLFLAATERLASGPVPAFDDAAGERAMNYWQGDVARLDAKTAGSIRISLTTALSRFENGWLADAFCGATTLVPELMMSGAIILMNFPVQTMGEDAAIAAKLFKFMAQRSLLARNSLAEHLRTRPVAIVADEAQNFLHHDAEFLAQCRSSRVAVLMATQSLPTLYAKVGSENPHDRAHHLVSNFNTVVMHSSACPETCEWFARKVGKAVQRRATFSENEGTNHNYGAHINEGTGWNRTVQDAPFFGLRSPFSPLNDGWAGDGSESGNDGWGRNRGHGSSRGSSWGYSEAVDWLIEPSFFARSLKIGGPAHGNRVSAVWLQAGRRFAASGGPALFVEFQQ